MADNHKRGGHEEHDVNIFAITKFGIGLTLVIIASLFAMWGLFQYFKNRLSAELPPAEQARAAIHAGKQPPQPRLQENPRVDLRAIRAEEDKLLHSYGWVDQSKGVVHIPIERAMDILTERGLPARPQTEGAK